MCTYTYIYIHVYIYTQSGIIFNYKKARKSIICTKSLEPEDTTLYKINHTQKDKYHMFSLYILEFKKNFFKLKIK